MNIVTIDFDIIMGPSIGVYNNAINEDFNNIIQGLYALQEHLDKELTYINNRFDYVEDKINELDNRQSKDDDFYKGLETLIQIRNNGGIK